MNPAGPADVLPDMLTKPETLATRILLGVSAVFLLVSAYEHLHLWDIAYRHVDTLGPLFILQGIAAIIIAIALVAWPRGIVVIAGLALSIGTILGFIKALNGGIFGFTLPVATNQAKLALGAEIGAIITLAVAGWLMWARRPAPASISSPSPA
jgi:hypothetical protein